MKKLLVIAFLMLALVLTVVACTDDPAKNPDAKKYDTLTYNEILAKNLKAIDLTASAIGRENGMPALIFGLSHPENITRAVMGENIGTLITE